ncbi:MAG: FadR/GntR family transcriptional regulator [Gammaproteobacteria bacterium]|nr:FadR/GntR family transcriptional regulator [Gammaproteobacteria bacterium]MDE0224158.1 FadR/GntR family transcriptional regulator [Gammaproteobacteria bacterium]MDE0453578.1 FadR/GntR family transcriptional regulator [Gammaproteobacteria bacterium]
MPGRRLYHSVAEKIVKLIDQGIFPPSSRLPGERELADQLGVSRVAVREAEIFLQARGIIEVKMGSGAYVLDPLEHDRGLPNVSAFELTEARTLFESEAAALAARDMSKETLKLLEGYLERMGGTDGDAELADREFHRTIASASGNAAVLHVVEILWRIRMESEAVRRVYDPVCHDDAEARLAEHRAILDALRQRNPAAARVAMREHFRRLIQSMLDVTEEQALEELRRKANESRERFLTSFQL